jgi:hypothetical protein
MDAQEPREQQGPRPGDGFAGPVVAQQTHLRSQRRIDPRQGQQGQAHQQKVDRHRGHHDIDAEEEVPGEVAAQDPEARDRAAQHQRAVRSMEARVHRSDARRENAVLGPGEGQSRDGQQHGRQIIDQGNGCSGQDGD